MWISSLDIAVLISVEGERDGDTLKLGWPRDWRLKLRRWPWPHQLPLARTELIIQSTMFCEILHAQLRGSVALLILAVLADSAPAEKRIALIIEP